VRLFCSPVLLLLDSCNVCLLGGEIGQARGLDNGVRAPLATPGLRWMAGPVQQTSIKGVEAGEIRTSKEALVCGTQETGVGQGNRWTLRAGNRPKRQGGEE
jgi:hypothetical protein